MTDPRAASVTHIFAEARGLRLHLLDFGGRGRPIMLLHGVTGHAWMWAGVAPRLKGVGRPIALDFRGYGESQWSADHDYTTSGHAEDVASIVNSLDTGQVDLVGFSWGALVAIETAARIPSKIRRLVMIDIPPSFDQSATEIPQLPEGFPGHAEVRAAERRSNPNAPEEMIDVMANHGTRPGLAGTLIKKHDPYFLTRWPFREDDLWDRLAGVDQPTLVVHAANSSVLSTKGATAIVDSLPHGSLLEVPASGHLIPVENPLFLASALIEFLGTDDAQ